MYTTKNVYFTIAKPVFSVFDWFGYT